MLETAISLLTGSSLAHDLLILSLVSFLGIALGHLGINKIHLGISGVLFSGLAFAHVGINISPEVLSFARECGLILFVFTVGLQVGPGFLDSFKAYGLKLNFLAALIVFLGFGLIAVFILSGILSPITAAGLFSGASTNTPSFGAVAASLSLMPSVTKEDADFAGMAYATAYPFGIMGIILIMILSRRFFRVNVADEERTFEIMALKRSPKMLSVNLHVENPMLDQVMIKDIPLLKEKKLVISRILHGQELRIAKGDSKIYLNDILHVVGTQQSLQEAHLLIGSISPIDLRLDVSSHLSAKRILVTKKQWVGHSIEEVVLSCVSEVAITRVIRAGVELPVSPQMRLHLADTIVSVGDEESLKKLADTLGNSENSLQIPELIPMFLGISLGIFLGSIPIPFPGLPYPVKLGLAGGPLFAAIILSRIGHIGKVSWYMPHGTNLFVRELGIAIFLACVGLQCGDRFVDTLIHGDGLLWMGLGAVVTLVPLLCTALLARLTMKLNFLSICGLLSGSMTNPPAVAFANTQSSSPACSLAYVSVYPLSMILRIIAAQFLIFLFI